MRLTEKKRGRPFKRYGLSKPCTKCNIDKPLSEYFRAGNSYRSSCKVCSSLVTKAYRKRNPDKVKEWKQGYRERHPTKVRNTHRNWRLSVLPIEYKLLEQEQLGLCAICRNPETRLTKTGDPRFLSLDHDHENGMLRGLLCNRCNIVLGHVEDDAELLEMMIKYLLIWRLSHSQNGGTSYLTLKDG